MAMTRERTVPASQRARSPISSPARTVPLTVPSKASMPPKRTRRTPDQIIADLQAEIARVKARAAQAEVRKDPALRHISGAVRAIDKAMGETNDKATRTELAEARATLSACLALNGAEPADEGER